MAKGTKRNIFQFYLTLTLPNLEHNAMFARYGEFSAKICTSVHIFENVHVIKWICVKLQER